MDHSGKTDELFKNEFDKIRFREAVDTIEELLQQINIPEGKVLMVASDNERIRIVYLG
jgi:hypothetical protein